MWGKQWLHKTVKKQPFKIVRHGHCTSGASCWCWNQGCLLCLPYVVCGKSSLCFKVLKCTGKTLLCLPYAVVSHHSSFVHVVFECIWSALNIVQIDSDQHIDSNDRLVSEVSSEPMSWLEFRGCNRGKVQEKSTSRSTCLYIYDRLKRWGNERWNQQSFVVK